MRIVFAGTPEFGIPCLEALHQSQHEIVAIYTQPDRPAGRGQKLQESAVKIWGNQHHIPIFQPLNFKLPETVDELVALKPDLMVVIAYGLILPKSVLSVPKLGCLNVHASILPKWRGAAPIQHAILAGDSETGVTIMQMDVGMDTGATYLVTNCPITQTDTTTSLHHKLSLLAPEPLLQTINGIVQGTLSPNIQIHDQATYAGKIHKQDAAIDWHQSADVIDRKIRAYFPWPIAYTHASDTTIRIHQAIQKPQTSTHQPGTIIHIDHKGMLVSTGQGAILIQILQCPGGRPMRVADYLNSQNRLLTIGTVLQ